LIKIQKPVILINSIKDTIYIRLKFVIPSWVVQMISFLNPAERVLFFMNENAVGV